MSTASRSRAFSISRWSAEGRGVFFDACRDATRSAAAASMRLSTSHSETTSTGATWIIRRRSVLPYHPVPISPTRLRVSANCPAYAGTCDSASATAPCLMKSRRFMSATSGSAHRLNTHVLLQAAGEHRVSARGQHGLAGCADVGEIRLRQGKSQLARFSGFERHFREASQAAHWRRDFTGALRRVDLDHLGPGASSRVAHRDRHVDPAAAAGRPGQGGILEAGVAQAGAELELRLERGETEGRVLLLERLVIVGEQRGHRARIRDGQLAAWIDVAEEHVRDGDAPFGP